MSLPTVVGTSASLAQNAATITPEVVNGSVGDWIIFPIAWGISYTGSTYPTEANRPTLSGGASANAIYLGTGVGGVNDPTEAWGVDTGKRCDSFWAVKATSATGTVDAITFSNTGSGTDRTMSGVAVRISLSANKTLAAAATFGSDGNKADSWAPTGMTNIGITVDDLIIISYVGVPDNTNLSSLAAATGATLSAATDLRTGAVTAGNDHRHNIRSQTCTAGTSSAAPAVTSATTGTAGAHGLVRLREVDEVIPTGVATSEALGSATISQPAPDATIPDGVATSAAVGSATITTLLTVGPTGIATGEALGSPTAKRYVQPTKRNTFDNVPEGDYITPANSASSGDAITGNGGDVEIPNASSAHTIRGTKSAHISTVDGETTYAYYDFSAPQSKCGIMFYYRPHTTPTVNHVRIAKFIGADAFPLVIHHRTTGTLVFQDRDFTVDVATSALTNEDEYKIECNIEKGADANTGKLRVRVTNANTGALFYEFSADDRNTGTADYTSVRFFKTESGGTADNDFDSISMVEDSLEGIQDDSGALTYVVTINDDLSIFDTELQEELTYELAITEALHINEQVTVQWTPMLLPDGVASGAALGSPTVASTLTVGPTGIATGEAIGTTVVQPKLTASPTGVGGSEAVGSPSIDQGASVVPTGIATAEVVPTVVLQHSLLIDSPAGIASDEAFGSPTIAPGSISVVPTGVVTGEDVGSASISFQGTLLPTGVASGEVFGIPTITTLLATLPAGIASGEAVGIPVVVLITPIQAQGIATAEALGAPTIALGSISVVPTGIASAIALGSPTITALTTVLAEGVDTSEALGDPTIGGVLVVIAGDIATEEAVGTPFVTPLTIARPIGIPTEHGMGNPVVVPGAATALPAAISSGAALGIPTVSGSNDIIPQGVMSEEAFGNTVVTSLITSLVAAGPSSQEGVGIPVIYLYAFITPTGVPSAEAFGPPVINTLVSVTVAAGPATAESVGTPVVKVERYTPWVQQGKKRLRWKGQEEDQDLSDLTDKGPTLEWGTE